MCVDYYIAVFCILFSNMNKLDPVDVLFKKVIYGPFYQNIIIQTLYKLLMQNSHNKSFSCSHIRSYQTKIWVWIGFVSEFHGYFRVGYPKNSKLWVFWGITLGYPNFRKTNITAESVKKCQQTKKNGIDNFDQTIN